MECEINENENEKRLGTHHKTTRLHKPNDYNLKLHNHETFKSETISRVLALTRKLTYEGFVTFK